MTDTPSISLKLKPWTSPNFAQLETPAGQREDGITEMPSFAVAELPRDALDCLARQWLDDLYKKAGKPNDWLLGSPKP